MTLEHYAQRLERIEHVLLLLAAVLCAVIVVLLLTAARAFSRKIVLRGRNGVARLTIGMSESGEPEVDLWGRGAKSWAKITCDSDGFPYLAASDREGRTRLCLRVSECGPYLCMLDEHGTPAMQAGMLDGDIPGVLIKDKSERHRFQICLDDAGAPYLVLYDGNSTRRLTVGVSPVAEPALVFFDRRGEERIGVGFDQNGDPFVHVLDEDGNVVNQLHPAKPGTSEL